MGKACSSACGASKAHSALALLETKASSEGPFVLSLQLSRCCTSGTPIVTITSRQVTVQSARTTLALTPALWPKGAVGKLVRAVTGCITAVLSEAACGSRAQERLIAVASNRAAFQQLKSLHALQVPRPETGKGSRAAMNGTAKVSGRLVEGGAKCTSSRKAAFAACSHSGNAWVCGRAQRRELSLCTAKVLSTRMASGKANRLRPLEDQGAGTKMSAFSLSGLSASKRESHGASHLALGWTSFSRQRFASNPQFHLVRFTA